MERRRRDYVILFAGLLSLATLAHSANVSIPVGVILDSDSSLGSISLNCINSSLQDFYSTHDSYYTTNLTLHLRDSGNDLLTAAAAAWDLINKEKVHAILGPQNSQQARHVVELGTKYDVPVIWFSPSGPSLLPPRTRFFVHSNLSRSHCSQFEAIAAIIKAYNWQSVIPIYEWPEFGIDLVPCLSYALREMDTRVPYMSAISQVFTDDQITKELKKTKEQRTYVFVAHMTVDLWSRLVEQAKKEAMMSEGYAWILTQGLSPVLEPKAEDIKEKGYMDGVLGLRPSLDVSLESTLTAEHNKSLSLYGLWAYDTITALANAVEHNNGLVNFNESTVDVRKETGPELHKAIQDADFKGRSGNFNLRKGQLEPSQFVIYNVQGPRENIIGYWRPNVGLFQKFSLDGEPASKHKLRDPTWPGNTTKRPPKLKIGVIETYFTEFVNVSGEGQNVSSATGFAVDVFNKVVEALQFTYDFVRVPTPSSYYDLLCKDIKTKNVDFDVIIGDITIVENRTDCVDFTMPYLDSSVSMVVKVRSDSKSGWVLLKPFDKSLWLILSAIFVVATAIVIILERTKTGNGDETKSEHFVHNPFLIYMSDVDKSFKRLTSKWVVIMVTFLLTIAVQVYTANLTSILSEKTTAKPSPWRDVQEIKRDNVIVGHQSNSWVKELLTKHIGLDCDQLKSLESREDYDKALLKGAKKGGVDVIFDETPYLRLLISNCSSCKMTGPIYKTGGFAFAFPKNSTLVSSFSTAILQVTQNVTTFHGMKKSISFPVTIDKSEYKNYVETRGLMKDDFGGLFAIVMSVLVLFFTLSILQVPWLQKKWVSLWSHL